MTLNEMRASAYGKIPVTSDSEKISVNSENKNITKPVFESINNHPVLKSAVEALENGGLIKVTSQKEKKKDEKESIVRRVAKFLVLVGTDEAAKILPHLSQDQTEKIVMEMAKIRYVSPDEAAEILKEFENLVEKSRESGGVETARSILEKAFGPEKASQLLDKAVPFKSGKPFDYLSEADSEKVSILLKDESVPVMAMVLSQLNPKVSAGVINGLDEELKKEVIVRLAKMQKIDASILQAVDKKMEEKFNKLNIEKSDFLDGRNTLAQILKRMSPEAEEKILNNLSETDAELGKDLRERLFTVEDIVNADDKFVQEILREMEDKDCALLIAGKDDGFRSKVLRNVSSNRAREILDCEHYNKPFLKSDVEKVTALFFSTLRRAWEDGKLFIKGRDEEIYV